MCYSLVVVLLIAAKYNTIQVKSSQVKYALFRHKQIHVSRPHMGDMASEKCINSKA